MARKANCACITEKGDFPQNLSALMKERGLSQQDLASALGIKRQTISLYTSGQSSPDIGRLKRIADYFGVSSDWLLGLSKSRSLDSDIQTVVRTTGLSDKAVNILKEMEHSEVALFSEIIENWNFDEFIAYFENYVSLRRAMANAESSDIKRLDSLRVDCIKYATKDIDDMSDVEKLYIFMRENLNYRSLVSFYFQKARDEFEYILKDIGKKYWNGPE